MVWVLTALYFQPLQDALFNKTAQINQLNNLDSRLTKSVTMAFTTPGVANIGEVPPLPASSMETWWLLAHM